MKRSVFLLVSGIILAGLGLFFILFPEKMLTGSLIEVDFWNINFAQTAGIFIACFGILSLLCYNANDSQALKAVLLMTAFMMIATASLDIGIRLSGTPLKNNASLAIRFLLASGYLYYWWQSGKEKPN